MDTSLLMLDWATLFRLFRTPMWSNVMNKASHGLLGECIGPGPSFVAIGHKSRLAGLHLCRPAPPCTQVQPDPSCDLPEGITFHLDSELGEPKLDFMYLDELFDMVQSKWDLMKCFCMYVDFLLLHSHNHHNLCKYLEISPMTMVYVIYITKLGIVDGLKWGVKDRQQHVP
jgi:hypothetical protein